MHACVHGGVYVSVEARYIKVFLDWKIMVYVFETELINSARMLDHWAPSVCHPPTQTTDMCCWARLLHSYLGSKLRTPCMLGRHMLTQSCSLPRPMHAWQAHADPVMLFPRPMHAWQACTDPATLSPQALGEELLFLLWYFLRSHSFSSRWSYCLNSALMFVLFSPN